MSRHTLYRDGVLVYDYTDGTTTPPEKPPEQPPEKPPEQPPAGNPSAIVAKWLNWWNAVYPNGFYLASGNVAAFLVPSPEEVPGADGVTMYIGQMPASPPGTRMEFYLSRSPGVIDSNDTMRYVEQKQFANNFSVKVWYRVSGWDMEGKMHAYPEPGPWYLNMRWTYAPPPSGVNPGAHSMQWNY